MKHLYTIGLCIAAMMTATSCVDDEPLNFTVAKPESVELQEQLNSYDALKSYIDRDANPMFKLGAGITLSEYTGKGVMYRLVNTNFDEVTPRTAMMHGSIVQADGSLQLAGAEDLLDFTNDAGLTVFGHSLAWHANQNAAYLKDQIAPLVVTSPGFANSLDLSALNDGTLSGWDHPNSGAGISIVEDEGMGGGVKAIRLTASANASGPEDLQLVTPEIPVVSGHRYEVLFFIKSDMPGEGRIAFEGLNNNTPPIDWTGSGTASETFTTDLGWKEIRFSVEDFTGENIKLHIDLGYTPDVTYYIDVNNFYVYDTEGEPLVNNLIEGGDFESGVAWGGWGNGSTRGVTAEGEGFGGSGKAFYVTNPSLTSGYWEVQSSYPFPGGALELGETYKLSFWVKGTTSGVIRPELQSASYASNGFGQVYVTTDWQKVDVQTTATAEDRIRLIISYGEFAGTVYMDDFVLSKAGESGGGTTIVEKTPTEKEAIVGGALQQWISGFVGGTKDHVQAWNVVNEPMDDTNPYELKTGEGRTLASDEFYWQDYLGKDYGVKAFQWARQYGNPDDKLFINDYGLETNLDKCRGLIEYVEYIEAAGLTVDGIGTQMHISTETDKDKIVTMFELLAATGKLIRISELYVRVGVNTGSATAEHYQMQADMYKFIVEKYMEIIPASQRYGITLWSPRDSGSGATVRPGEPIGLWTEGYDRKRAYVGFADGL